MPRKLPRSRPPTNYRTIPKWRSTYEEFCQAVADGEFPSWAYKRIIAGPKTKFSTCQEEASRMMRIPKIQARIAELRVTFKECLEQKLGIRQESVARFLHTIIETPVGSVDENHPLAQEMQRTRRAVGRGEDAEEWETEKIKIPSKTEAASLLNKMAGWNADEKLAVTVTNHPEVGAALDSLFGAEEPKKGKRGK